MECNVSWRSTGGSGGKRGTEFQSNELDLPPSMEISSERRLAPGPSWQHPQTPLMSGICQHSGRTIGSQGRSQFVLDLIKSSQPYQLLKRKGEKRYKAPLARVRIAKKRKGNKRALTKETCSQDSSSKAPFIQLFPQVVTGQNRVPTIAVSTDNMSLTPIWGSCSLSYSMFSPQTSYSFWDLSPFQSLLRSPLTLRAECRRYLMCV